MHLSIAADYTYFIIFYTYLIKNIDFYIYAPVRINILCKSSSICVRARTCTYMYICINSCICVCVILCNNVMCRNYAGYNNMYYVGIYRDIFFCIDRTALLLFRFNRRSSIHGSPIGRQQRSGICHFRHQRHSVFANSANASCRSARRYMATSGFSGLHTPSGISLRKFSIVQEAMISTISKQVYIWVCTLDGNI